MFLEAWKRTNASLAHRWDVTDFEEEEVNEIENFNYISVNDILY